jgi:rhodanese-related sulfurtransferase/rubrerythrin
MGWRKSPMKWKQFLTPVGSMEPEETRTYIAEHSEGSYTLLDVRQPGEYEKERIAGATLLPLPELSDRLGEVDPKKPVIVYCAVGGRSRAAAQFLAGQGFQEVYNLKGGVRAWKGQKAGGPPDRGMAMISGEETPSQILILAYGLEEGLRGFYSEMESRVKDEALSDLFSRLAQIEIQHKRRLFEHWKELEHDSRNMEAFDTQVISKAMEGGFSSEEFLEHNRWALETVPDVLTLAMMIETQGLDLYLRYASKSDNRETKKVLFEIAEEEKRHLRYLGDLMDSRA